MVEIILASLVGLIIGSFLGVLSYRFPRGESTVAGRSKCNSCQKVISWFDNIPLISYILLQGKCRNCKNKIPFRDFLIEVGTGIIFVILVGNIGLIKNNIFWLNNLGELALPFLLLITSILIVIFVIDLEHQLIFDEFVFVGILTIFVALLVTNIGIWQFLISGSLASLFLLSINFVTNGRGMGLGDVKLAILLGSIFTVKLAIAWLFTSFVTGGLVGIILILFGNATLKQKVAFAPFLIIGFFIIILFGNTISQLILPI